MPEFVVRQRLRLGKGAELQIRLPGQTVTLTEKEADALVAIGAIAPVKGSGKPTATQGSGKNLTQGSGKSTQGDGSEKNPEGDQNPPS